MPGRKLDVINKRFTVDDYQYMSLALRLAEKGLYTTGPNPRVGCVLVRDGAIVGQGWHRRAGEPHAEIHALREAGDAARGATAYVTLEPCCHHARTPPCTESLLGAGVARVVAAMEDPNPQVAGRGAERLAKAGLVVQIGLMQTASAALNPGFVMRMCSGRPYVRSKLAMSLDGRTAMASGDSQWITGEHARRDVHRLRARSSAIMTGIGTVLADDPALSVRLEPQERARLGIEGQVPQPLRVVLDPHLSMPKTAQMLGLPGRTIVVTSAEDLELCESLAQAGAQIVQMPGREGNIDLPRALRYLAELEVNEVLLETGATLSGAMLRDGLIDEFVFYLAPHLMGDQARALFHLPGLSSMDERIDLEILEIRAVGRDWRIRARPRGEA
jgi:diaminohydroxyphosphoribosylaminopyrimidine deaminase/5-amino-6-(5-phosphoribosylamino)uracil reductase